MKELQFQRIDRLPPYVFAIVNDLKMAARREGEDIIDLGMGNPDQATPKHIIDKLVEAAQKPTNHRYSVSRGHGWISFHKYQSHFSSCGI